MEPWTIIEGGTLGIADGDETPEPLSGVLVITPRFATLSTETGFIVTGPIYVPVKDGVIPEIHVPAVEDGTALVEFRLKGQLCGPVEFPDTEIPVEPETTIRLSDYIPRGIDPGTGGILVPGPPGPPGPAGRGVVSIADDDGDGTATVTYSDGETAPLPLPVSSGGDGMPVGMIPIFETQAEAEEWEDANPGRVALWLGEGGEVPDDPDPSNEATDFTHQWVASGVSVAGWTASRGGVMLPREGAGSATVSGDVVTFPGDASVGPVSIPFTGEPTITLVVRTLGTEYGFVAGDPIDNGVTAPGGTGRYSIGNSAPFSGPTTGQWEVVTARWGTPGDTQRAVTAGFQTFAGATTKEPPETMNFRIGGKFLSGYYFTGELREVRIYNRRLTDEEVLYTHEALMDRYGITS